MIEGILKNRYRQVNNAMVAKDTKTLAELIAPDSVLVHIMGYVQPVKEWLGGKLRVKKWAIMHGKKMP